MRKNFGKKTWLYPMPVLIVTTYNEDGTPNAMNAAWGGVYDTDQIMLCLSQDHRTTGNIRARGAFTVSIADAAHAEACDYVGMVSGRKVPDQAGAGRIAYRTCGDGGCAGHPGAAAGVGVPAGKIQ